MSCQLIASFPSLFFPQSFLYEAAILITSWIPSLNHAVFTVIFKKLDSFPAHIRVDKSYRVFNIPHRFPPHNEGEMVVGIDDCADAIRELQQFVNEESIPLNYVIEVGHL